MKDRIILAARECLGTPFRHQGRTVGHGLDCVGVAIHVARRLYLSHEDSKGYGRNPTDGLLQDALEAQICLERVALVEWESADLLLMRFDIEPQHVAIWTGETIIHAYAQSRKCVEHALDDVWRSRICRAYKFKEV